MRFFLTALALLSTSTALMANDIVISGVRVIVPDTGLGRVVERPIFDWYAKHLHWCLPKARREVIETDIKIRIAKA